MLEKNSCYLILSLMAGCLFMYNASASQSGDQPLAIHALTEQQQKVAQSADSTIEDAESALMQARHVLLEAKPHASVHDPEYRQLQNLVTKAALNFERAQAIADREEGVNSQV